MITGYGTTIANRGQIMPSSDTYFTKDNQPETQGRTKGSKNAKTLLEAIVNQEISDGNGQFVTKEVLMHSNMVNKAIEGDVRAYKEVLDRKEGQVKQEIDQNIKSNVVRVIRAGEE